MRAKKAERKSLIVLAVPFAIGSADSDAMIRMAGERRR